MRRTEHYGKGVAEGTMALVIALAVGVLLSSCADDDHDDHSGHDHAAHSDSNTASGGHDDEEPGLRLTPEQRQRFGITMRVAGPGVLKSEVRLPGEIVFNDDKVVHLVPRVAGIVRKGHKTVGDPVKAGEVMAVIDSRELADAKSEYLAAKARAVLAEKTLLREKVLREKQVSSEQDYLEAEQAAAEAGIGRRSAEQKLHALGLSPKTVSTLETAPVEAITRYEIRSPIDGVVTEKHLSLGEALAADADIFTVVDTRSVWVRLAVYTKNLGLVKKGQDIVLRVDHNGAEVRAKVAMTTPFVDGTTRSATARVELDNSTGRWMPGTFATGVIRTSKEAVKVVVPRGAVQVVDGESVVFIKHEGTFETVPVKVGMADRENVEIVSGLKPGTSYVAKGAFELKTTLVTSTLDSHAGHGH